MRRKEVNMVYVRPQEQTKSISRSESIKDTLKEFTHLLSAEIPSDKCVSLGNETNVKSSSIQEKPAGVDDAPKSQNDANEITKEMLNWKHKYHALENEKQKLATQTEEKMKKREEVFQVELAAEAAAYSAKMKEFSDEIQRLVTENEALRKQLAANNIDPTTTLLDSDLNENDDYANSDRNLLKVGHMVPRDELVALAREQERSASQMARDTFRRALPGLFVRNKSDRRKSKGGSSRVDNSDTASIRSCDTTSSIKTADTRWSVLDSRQSAGECLLSDEVPKMPKSATIASGLRSLISSNQSTFDDNEEVGLEDELHDINYKLKEQISNQTQTPYILRHSKDPDNMMPPGGIETLPAKQNDVAWTKRKRVVPINALPPIMSTSQSHPSHLHR
ncbi:hypothetical protein INT43_004455 [Umbelopsis isabellina]|uniref:Uncharacterized protein n=1 Tax=Mortierella isabellina TaxID=91625 RepID=A0A8H7PI54_MORIS|nr:hypothetical protein INT43_004455 [Umbelopsis isabellina]